MRTCSVLVMLLFLAPAADAGTQDDPEVTDPAGDVERWPGVPTHDPTVDMIGIWFEEDADNLYISMEMVEAFVGPEFTNTRGAPNLAVSVFVNGEGEQTPCSGWGKFGVNVFGAPADLRASLRVYWPMEDQDDGCTGDDHDLNATADGTIMTWTIPKNIHPELVQVGDVLTVARAQAWSSSTYPTTPIDRADHAPGRPYAIQSAPVTEPALDVAEPQAPRAPNVATTNTTAPTDAQEAPGIAPITVALGMLMIAARRRFA